MGLNIWRIGVWVSVSEDSKAAVPTWTGIGSLESGLALEVLRVCKLLPHASYDDALVEGGPNGEAFQDLVCVGSTKKGRKKRTTWTQLAKEVSQHLSRPINAATCQSSACKLLQVLSALTGGSTYNRARVPGQNVKQRHKQAGKKLIKLAGLRTKNERSNPRFSDLTRVSFADSG